MCRPNSIFTVLLALPLLLAPCAVEAVRVSDGVTETFEFQTRPTDPASQVARMPNAPFGPLEVRVRPEQVRYHIGDSARINFSANRACQVFVFITDNDGVSRLIFPNFFDQDNRVQPNRQYSIPDRRYELQVVGPEGTVELTVLAVERDFPFLREWRQFRRDDPYPVYRDGAAGLARRIESFRREPSVFEPRAIRPAPRQQMYATDTTSFHVMGTSVEGFVSSRFGTLDLYTQPDNARIFVDGVFHGRTPEFMDRLDVGYRTIRIEKEGHLPYERRVYIRPREVRKLDVFLEPTPVEPGYSRSDKPRNQGFFFLPKERLD